MRVCFQIITFLLAVNFYCQPLRAQGKSVCVYGFNFRTHIAVGVRFRAVINLLTNDRMVYNSGLKPSVSFVRYRSGPYLLIQWQLASRWPDRFRSYVVRLSRQTPFSNLTTWHSAAYQRSEHVVDCSLRCLRNHKIILVNSGNEMSSSHRCFFVFFSIKPVRLNQFTALATAHHGVSKCEVTVGITGGGETIVKVLI